MGNDHVSVSMLLVLVGIQSALAGDFCSETVGYCDHAMPLAYFRDFCSETVGYCDHGCCGEYCCTLSPNQMAGIVIGSFLGFAVILCCVCPLLYHFIKRPSNNVVMRPAVAGGTTDISTTTGSTLSNNPYHTGYNQQPMVYYPMMQLVAPPTMAQAEQQQLSSASPNCY